MIDHISIVMITKNAGAVLRNSLQSLSDFAEVVVYDNGSTDDTLEIARSFVNVKLHEGGFLGFGPTKNHAVSLASNDWVFSLDADEALSKGLIDELRHWSSDEQAACVGEVRRDNYLMGRHVRHAGWGKDWLIRLFNRRMHQFSESAVHEKVQINAASQIVRLKNPVQHDAVRELGQFLEKINYYSEIRKQTSNKTYHPLVIFLRSAFAFFRSYVLQLGFLDGWRGLVIAVSNANGVFYKYMKIYAKRRS